MIELQSLTFDENKKYQAAISRGYLENYTREWRHTFVGAYLNKNPLFTKVIDTFRNIIGHIPTWSDITDTNLKDWRDELMKNHSPNSVKTIMAQIKAVINDNIEEYDIPSKRYAKILSAKSQPTQSVYINLEELSKILNYDPVSRRERYVKKIFCIEALTGARIEDAMRLSLNNCNLETRNLSYVAMKTHTNIILPMHESVYEYLADPYKEKIGNPRFNANLRQICRKCGINDTVTIFKAGKETTGEKWQFVTSHTGRKSFATNLYLNKVDPLTISKMMGHANPEMTVKRYIIAPPEIDENTKNFFRQII